MSKIIAFAVLAFAVGGCIEIANVESFVTLPRDMVSFGIRNERKTENEEDHVCGALRCCRCDGRR